MRTPAGSVAAGDDAQARNLPGITLLKGEMRTPAHKFLGLFALPSSLANKFMFLLNAPASPVQIDTPIQIKKAPQKGRSERIYSLRSPCGPPFRRCLRLRFG